MAKAKKFSEDLRPASFRSVSFKVDAAELTAGRRTIVHEYPQRDKPWAEDLGRATRDLSFDGFVIGADYITQANKLIGALESAGPGALVHPWLGTLKVSVKDLARISFDHALGYARISMSFVESGDMTFPSAADSTQAQSRIAAGNIESAAVSDFAKKFSVDGFQDYVRQSAQSAITSAFEFLGGNNIPGLADLGYANKAADYLTEALALLSNPTALGWKIAGFIGITELVGVGLRWSGIARSLAGASQSKSLAPPSAPIVYTPSRQQTFANESAITSLIRQTLLAQAVGASSLAPCDVYDDAAQMRAVLTAALDAESLNAADDAYIALHDARGKVWKDINERARDSARLMTITPIEVMPALVIAYNQYEDASRDIEIVARNKIENPGFVPVKPLKILSR